MLPLGIDIGTSRVRVAVVSVRGGKPYVHNVVVRDLPPGSSSSGAIASPQIVAEILRDAVAEAGVRERRCVAAISSDEAVLTPVAFPKMSAFERGKAARFEASRFVSYPLEECTVRVVSSGRDGEHVLGIARTKALRSRVAALRAAGLRPVALDHETCVWRRAIGEADCVVDLGFVRCTVVALADPFAGIRTLRIGGEAITRHIARSLGIDEEAAESRKRGVGGAAAGGELGTIVGELADAILELRSGGRAIGKIALTGNGARIAGLPAALERVTGVPTTLAEFPQGIGSEYPSDVMRAGAPDWLFAFGIALWSVT